MGNRRYGFLAVGAGLAVAQIIAALQVRLSGSRYYRKIAAVQEGGYLTVPDLRVAETLNDIGPAFFGGLFFSLTVGLSLALAGFGAAWAWDRIFHRERKSLTPVMLLWLGILLFALNGHFLPFVIAYVVLVPLVAFWLTCRFMPQASAGEESSRAARKRIAVHLIALVLLIVAGVQRGDVGGYVAIRDHLFLTNPAGRAINNFYYRYTLYPAQVFKSLSQDQIRSAHLSGFADTSPTANRLRRTLNRYDYLVIDAPEAADVTIAKEGEQWTLLHRGEPVLQTDAREFFSRTRDILKQFSRKTDPYAGFRQFTFLSLLLVTAITIYLILCLPFRLMTAFFLKGLAASAAAAGLGLVTGSLFLLLWQPGATVSGTEAALMDALSADDAGIRIAALQRAHRQEKEIGDTAPLERMAESPCLLERYWLAKALRYSRSPGSEHILVALLDDPQINVSYTAVDALGRRGNPRVIPEIRHLIETTDEWYVQMYAYKALRRLGWRQTRSD